MEIIRPLQVSFYHRVFEQNRRFYFTASAILGVEMNTGRALLEMAYLKDAFAAMGEPPLPDMGMPKPRGEFLVSGSFYAAGGRPVPQGEVAIRFDQREKRLALFGDRRWRLGMMTRPEPFTRMPLDFAHAYGGPEYRENPLGRGHKDGRLPCIEDPERPVLSPGDSPLPAGFGAMDPSWPQRMRFSGTYNRKYRKRYFPGYPPDMDGSYFMCAPEDQWFDGYFRGDEPFVIQNMHPDIPVMEGRLPGLYPRCFLLHTLHGEEAAFDELPLDLDTVWFFPGQSLVLLFWRGVVEVFDDEAEEITHALAAYENSEQMRRSPDYYRRAFEKRGHSDDALLNSLNTEDLIPDGDRCAMELLQEMAFADDAPSAFGQNMDAKAASIRETADAKIEEAVQEAEKNMATLDIPDEAGEQVRVQGVDFMSADGGIDLRKMMKPQPGAEPDADMEALNRKMEAILPGVTGGDPRNIELKNFSFDQIDELMEAVDEFTGKKEAQAMGLAKTELAKAKSQAKAQMETALEQVSEPDQKIQNRFDELEKALENLDVPETDQMSRSPLPRLKADEFIGQVSDLDPQVQEALQHLQGMKGAEGGGEQLKDIERQIREKMETQSREMETALRDAEKDFKEIYMMGAHFMPNGLPPHKEPLEEVAERLVSAVAAGEKVSGGDWACIDLRGRNLDGVDLSGAFLEQVDFTGASLIGANLKRAILARATLTDADLSGADLTEANLGGVHALRAKFSDADLNSAKLSKGDFTEGDFTGCELADVESLEILLNGALFSETHMPDMQFIQSDLTGARFPKADLNTALFYDCILSDVDFRDAVLTRSTWADVRLNNVRFDGADLTAACFAATDPRKAQLRNVSFFRCRLDQACFRGMILSGADLSEASMESALFNNADLTGADLSFSQARSAQFRKSRLTDARLNYINLMEGSLAKADLVNASFIGANLYAVDMLRATIEDTDFSDSYIEAAVKDE